MSLSIDAALPPKSGPANVPSPSASVTGADFAATLRDFTLLEDEQLRRFARLNAFLGAGPPAYPDPLGCRSWLVW